MDSWLQRIIMDRVLMLTIVYCVGALAAIVSIYLIWREFNATRYRGTRENTQARVRHRASDLKRNMERDTRRIDPGSIARARSMLPASKLHERRSLSPDWRRDMALERLAEAKRDETTGWGTADEC